MPRAKVTSKGQITIPAEVRKAMGIETGSTVIFWANEDGSFRMVRARSIMELEGCLAGLIPPMTVEEMDEGIGKVVAEEYLRSVGELPEKEAASEAA
jgi:AbrB family looped-hinge helix DNA binding protein